jgi:hypothetical protein
MNTSARARARQRATLTRHQMTNQHSQPAYVALNTCSITPTRSYVATSVLDAHALLRRCATKRQRANTRALSLTVGGVVGRSRPSLIATVRDITSHHIQCTHTRSPPPQHSRRLCWRARRRRRATRRRRGCNSHSCGCELVWRSRKHVTTTSRTAHNTHTRLLTVAVGDRDCVRNTVALASRACSSVSDGTPSACDQPCNQSHTTHAEVIHTNTGNHARTYSSLLDI